MKKILFLSAILATAIFSFSSCEELREQERVQTNSVSQIEFNTTLPLFSLTHSKASAVTSLSSFNVGCVTGELGASEVEVWNAVFTSTGNGNFTGNKFWPGTDASYKFYASNAELIAGQNGYTVSVSNSTDVVCAVLPSPSYKSLNTLQFEHILARLGNITVQAAEGYTISNIRISIIPKVSGTYNLYAGLGHSNGTGWSSLISGTETVVFEKAAPGVQANDLYLVPGVYEMTASWTATRGVASETYTNVVANIEIVAGSTNALTSTLSGNLSGVNYSMSISDWGDENGNVSFDPTPGNPPSVPTFAGLQIAQGNLYWDGSEFSIDEAWDSHCTYNTASGVTASTASSYFSFLEMGALFEKPGFDYEDGDIENLLNPLNGWRLPTIAEWRAILPYLPELVIREGSTVNGTANAHWAGIELTGVTYAGDSTPFGILVFPDGKSISGKALSGVNSTYSHTLGVTIAELTEYLEQGCVFLPVGGFATASNTWFLTYGFYLTSSTFDDNTIYCGDINAKSSATGGPGSCPVYDRDRYVSIRLVK